MSPDTQTKPKKKALGYLRISDKKQIKGESIANQKATISIWAKANNIEVIRWFTDKAKSGKNAERDELQNLLKTAFAMKGQIEYVIVYKMSRASRDVESYITGIRSILIAIAPAKQNPPKTNTETGVRRRSR